MHSVGSVLHGLWCDPLALTTGLARRLAAAAVAGLAAWAMVAWAW
jgi:hypothetical protein